MLRSRQQVCKLQTWLIFVSLNSLFVPCRDVAFETTEVNHTVILNTDSHRKREDTGRTQASAPVVSIVVMSSCDKLCWYIEVKPCCFNFQVDRRCVKCGSEKMEYRTQQTRSADEGQTVFYTCPKCGLVFSWFFVHLFSRFFNILQALGSQTFWLGDPH